MSRGILDGIPEHRTLSRNQGNMNKVWTSVNLKQFLSISSPDSFNFVIDLSVWGSHDGLSIQHLYFHTCLSSRAMIWLPSLKSLLVNIELGPPVLADSPCPGFSGRFFSDPQASQSTPQTSPIYPMLFPSLKLTE